MSIQEFNQRLQAVSNICSWKLTVISYVVCAIDEKRGNLTFGAKRGRFCGDEVAKEDVRHCGSSWVGDDEVVIRSRRAAITRFHPLTNLPICHAYGLPFDRPLAKRQRHYWTINGHFVQPQRQSPKETRLHQGASAANFKSISKLWRLTVNYYLPRDKRKFT